MKPRLILLTILLLSGLVTMAQAISQRHLKLDSASKNYKEQKANRNQYRLKIQAEGVGTKPSGKLILLLTPTVPFSFGQVQKDNSDKWQVSPAATLGASYCFVIGKGYRDADSPDDKPIQVEPYLTLGVHVNVGVSQNIQTVGGGGAIGNLNIGGILGVYKYINLLGAYDVLNNRGVYGIGARIDIFSFAQGAGSVVLNKKDF